MKEKEYLHVIGEKISYRRLNDGIKFYVRASSRSDQFLLHKLRKKHSAFLLITLAGITPVFFPLDPLLKWSFVLLALFPAGILIHFLSTYYLKKYGIETLTLKKNNVSYKHYINLPAVSVVLSQQDYTDQLVVRKENFPDMKVNMLISHHKIITSYVKLVKSKKEVHLLFHPELKEQDELIAKLEELLNQK